MRFRNSHFLSGIGVRLVTLALSNKSGLTRRITSCIPFLGASEGFVQALRDYQLGRVRNDEVLVKTARKNGVIAVSDFGVDLILAMLLPPFSGRLILQSAGLSSLRSGSLALYITRIGRAIGVSDPVEALAEEFSASPLGARLIDLTFETARRTLVGKTS